MTGYEVADLAASVMANFLTALTVFLALACGEPARLERGDSAASVLTAERNRTAAKALDFGDRRAFEDAERGLIAAADPAKVAYPDIGGAGRHLSDWAFLEGEAPPTVHPSLWRQAQLNNRAGLYRVVPGIHQLRGFDLANMTLIDGESGWIVVDPLTTIATARDAIAFARKHLGDRPVSAVLYTHSHGDHFGGASGVLDTEDAVARGVPIVAPAGFMEAALKENLMAGPAMLRRAMLVYGRSIEIGPEGNVGIGLGKALAMGAVSMMPPTRTVERTGERFEIDGVSFEFQLANGSEAPSEFTFYLPRHKAFCGAEVVSMNMHNVYTLRGARVRDALAWSDYIDEALRRFSGAEVYFGSHHWPVWGRSEVVDFLEGQRDLYKYIHDQTIRLANQGMTPREIAEAIVLPPALAGRFDLRGYYGSVRQNVKAVYDFYFGWYDGNPANLDPLPPEQAAHRWVELAGGRDAMLAHAQEAYDAGEYRWAAEVLDRLVFSAPDAPAPRTLLASTYRQLAYVSESTQWRNSYLAAAQELEQGPPEISSDVLRSQRGVLITTPVDAFFQAMAVAVHGERAAESDVALGVVFTDLGERYRLAVRNGVLHHRPWAEGENVDATLEITRKIFLDLLVGDVGLTDMLTSDDIALTGSRIDTLRFLSLFSLPAGAFPIVTP
jgi:alkyl sulfatase BDS1-like metallo-beta-lactamase superfamily hydrolase